MWLPLRHQFDILFVISEVYTISLGGPFTKCYCIVDKQGDL